MPKFKAEKKCPWCPGFPWCSFYTCTLYHDCYCAAGGTHSHSLQRLVVELSMWLQSQDMAIREITTLSLRHIPGYLNVIAGCLSWPNPPITTKWSLHPEIVTQIFKIRGSLTVDMLPHFTTLNFPPLSCL